MSIDRFLCAYNAAAFERVVRRYPNGPRSLAFYAFLNIVIATIMLAGACAVLAVTGKSLYLDAYGVETPGKVLNISFHTDHRRIKWEKLQYEFTARQGGVIGGQLDRPVRELRNLPDSNRFTVRYWDRFPTISSPRGVQPDVGAMEVFAGFLLLGSVHFSCLAWRTIRWRRHLQAASGLRRLR